MVLSTKVLTYEAGRAIGEVLLLMDQGDLTGARKRLQTFRALLSSPSFLEQVSNRDLTMVSSLSVLAQWGIDRMLAEPKRVRSVLMTEGLEVAETGCLIVAPGLVSERGAIPLGARVHEEMERQARLKVEARKRAEEEVEERTGEKSKFKSNDQSLFGFGFIKMRGRRR